MNRGLRTKLTIYARAQMCVVSRAVVREDLHEEAISAGNFLTRYLQQKDRRPLRARYSPAALVAEGRRFSMRFPP